MGSGSTAYRATLGESLGIREHETAMIEIARQKGEMELALQQRAFEQQLAQAERAVVLENVLAAKAAPAAVAGPIVTASAPYEPPPLPAAQPAAGIPKELIYAGLAIGAFLLLR